MEYGNDPSVDAAAAKLLGRFTAQAEGEPEKKRSEAPAQDQDDDIALPGDDVDVDGYKPDEALTEGADAQETEAEGEEAQRSQEEFFELPGEGEGAEAEMIPRADVIAAVRQMRQLNGDVAGAVIRAEEEAFTKQDQITTALAKTFETVEKQAKLALEMMYAYAPREPDPRQYNSTEDYYQAKLDYDGWVSHYNKVAATLKQAESGIGATTGQQDTEALRRETERAARYIPEYKTEEGRAAWKANVEKVLGPKYGITRADIDELADHRAVRILDALTKAEATTAEAPATRQAVKESAPKLTAKGNLPPRDKSNGQFVSEAKKRLQAEGSEAAFANKLLVSGFIR